MLRRVLPVSSGKGGVGKTTFAVNFALALSRAAPTVLLDLDTGTSSVRTALKVPIERDLYHFWKKGEPLARCVTRLPAALDPAGQFQGFGFVAGPRHYIEELTVLGEAFRRRLALEVGSLGAEYVVLDLKAGLDHSVIDLLPYTNSGILVFTPGNPAATLAAADLVKAILFRSLRVLFGDGSALLQQASLEAHAPRMRALLEQAEDVYEESVPNLDAFLAALEELLGPHAVVDVLRDLLAEFRVHSVLNMFNGVEESYEGAVVPLIKSLAEGVSARLRVTQLGWIVYDGRVAAANANGVPIVLDRRGKAAPPPPAFDPVASELAAIESAYLPARRGSGREKPSGGTAVRAATRPEVEMTEDALEGQLLALKAMYSGRRDDTVRENFSYLVYRALALMGADRSPSEFGQSALVSPEQLQAWVLAHQRAKVV